MSVQRTSHTETVPYVTLEWADAYLNDTLDWSVWWSNTTDDIKNKALRQATREIDQVRFAGTRRALNQVREWPRYIEQSSADPELYLPDTLIPERLAQATAIQAAYIVQCFKTGHLRKDRADIQSQGLTGVSRTGASESYDLTRRKGHSLHPEAAYLLSPYRIKSIG